jgi:hypothetical protein
MPLADIAKIAISLALIAPLAFCMGMPFPLALSQIAVHRPGLVPWAWGINGCSSVLSAILATLFAMSFGTVLLLALGLYLLAAATVSHVVRDRGCPLMVPRHHRTRIERYLEFAGGTVAVKDGSFEPPCWPPVSARRPQAPCAMTLAIVASISATLLPIAANRSA